MAYLEAFMTRNPGAQPVLWYVWHPGAGGLDSKAKVKRWAQFERAMTRVQDSVVERINLSAANKGYSWRLDGCPMNFVASYVIDAALTTNVPGITQGSDAATIGMFSIDPAGMVGTHIGGPVGDYLLQCVFMSHLYKRSPIGAAHPVNITSQQASSIQQLVWEAMLRYTNYREWTPTMAEARSHLTRDANVYNNEHFATNTNHGIWHGEDVAGRFFRFASASDNAFWHPIP
jgi:hypothetical protein